LKGGGLKRKNTGTVKKKRRRGGTRTGMPERHFLTELKGGLAWGTVKALTKGGKMIRGH